MSTKLTGKVQIALTDCEIKSGYAFSKSSVTITDTFTNDVPSAPTVITIDNVIQDSTSTNKILILIISITCTTDAPQTANISLDESMFNTLPSNNSFPINIDIVKQLTPPSFKNISPWEIQYLHINGIDIFINYISTEFVTFKNNIPKYQNSLYALSGKFPSLLDYGGEYNMIDNGDNTFSQMFYDASAVNVWYYTSFSVLIDGTIVLDPTNSNIQKPDNRLINKNKFFNTNDSIPTIYGVFDITKTVVMVKDENGDLKFTTTYPTIPNNGAYIHDTPSKYVAYSNTKILLFGIDVSDANQGINGFIFDSITDQNLPFYVTQFDNNTFNSHHPQVRGCAYNTQMSISGTTVFNIFLEYDGIVKNILITLSSSNVITTQLADITFSAANTYKLSDNAATDLKYFINNNNEISKLQI